MVEIAEPYSAEIMASMEAMIEQQVTHFLPSEREEHRAASEKIMADMLADPALKERVMQEVTDDFNAADSNGDGILTRDEYMAFVAKRNERKRAQGLLTDEREGVYEA